MLLLTWYMPHQFGSLPMSSLPCLLGLRAPDSCSFRFHHELHSSCGTKLYFKLDTFYKHRREVYATSFPFSFIHEQSNKLLLIKLAFTTTHFGPRRRFPKRKLLRERTVFIRVSVFCTSSILPSCSLQHLVAPI